MPCCVCDYLIALWLCCCVGVKMFGLQVGCVYLIIVVSVGYLGFGLFIVCFAAVWVCIFESLFSFVVMLVWVLSYFIGLWIVCLEICL